MCSNGRISLKSMPGFIYVDLWSTTSRPPWTLFKFLLVAAAVRYFWYSLAGVFWDGTRTFGKVIINCLITSAGLWGSWYFKTMKTLSSNEYWGCLAISLSVFYREWRSNEQLFHHIIFILFHTPFIWEITQYHTFLINKQLHGIFSHLR